MRRFAPITILLAVLLVSCATADPTENPDQRSDAAQDVGDGTDAAPADTTPPEDTTPPDTAPPEDTAPVDATPDPGRDTELPFDCEVRGDECEPSAIFCDRETNAVTFCSRCGEILRTEPCDEMEVCEFIDGAGRCRACEGDECPLIADCEPGERTCLDWNTSQVCGPDGTIDTVADCPGGRRCFEGSCGSPGGVTGTTCEVNIDPVDGCNGHSCVCGEQWLALGDTDGICETTFPRGYCTTPSCATNRCNTETEVCADFALSGMLNGVDMCVTREDCSVLGRICGDEAAGLRCVELPSRRGPGSPVEWEMACWLRGLNTIGASCTSDRDCLGGVCRAGAGSLADVRYCTSECGASGGCPSHASCVEDPDGEFEYVCLADGNNVDCPRIESEPLNIAPTPPLRRYGMGSVAACYFARR